VDDSRSSGRTRLPLVALLTANAVSLLGNVVAVVAIPWLVLEETGSAALTGVAASAAALPLALGAFLGGAVVDRIGARAASVAADLTSALAVAAIPLLDAAGQLSFGAIAAAAFLGALFDAPGQAARQALVPELAERARVPLERANAWLVGTEHFGYVLGAPLGGALVTILGAANALWIDAASFALSALLVAAFVQAARPAMQARRGYLAELLDGLRFLAREPLVRTLLVLSAAGTLLISPLAPVFLPVYAREQLGGASDLGIAVAAYGAGGLAGTALAGIVAGSLPRRTVWLAAWLPYGAFWLGLVALPPLAGLLALLFAIGLTAGALGPIETTLRQERTPRELRGRVLSTVAAALAITIPVGTLLAGLAVEWLGLRAALALFAASNVALALAAVLIPAARKLSPRPAAGAP
jgi:MFS family permease